MADTAGDVNDAAREESRGVSASPGTDGGEWGRLEELAADDWKSPPAPALVCRENLAFAAGCRASRGRACRCRAGGCSSRCRAGGCSSRRRAGGVRCWGGRRRRDAGHESGCEEARLGTLGSRDVDESHALLVFVLQEVTVHHRFAGVLVHAEVHFAGGDCRGAVEDVVP